MLSLLPLEGKYKITAKKEMRKGKTAHKMRRVYIKKVQIEKVRHLSNLEIPISEDGEFRHLILTGKNGSGKTSLLDALAQHLKYASTTNQLEEGAKGLKQDQRNLGNQVESGDSESAISETKKRIEYWQQLIEKARCGLDLVFNVKEDSLRASFEHSEYILAYFQADRSFKAIEPDSIEKVKVKDHYSIDESPRQEFLKYMLDLKMVQALAISKGDQKKASELYQWFDRIQEILRDIYDDPKLKLEFDEESYRFLIHEEGREVFDFNTASDGFSAVLDIVMDLILRMQQQDHRVVNFDKPGIVLIDEIENHLHLELQKRILQYLTQLFPNIQFIVTTHSPFVLNTLDNATVYDLENHTLVRDGMTNVSYSGIVEGYFRTDELSEELRNKFEQYKKLVHKEKLDNEDLAELKRLELYLDEIPDYLSVGIAAEYQKLKLELDSRKDI